RGDAEQHRAAAEADQLQRAVGADGAGLDDLHLAPGCGSRPVHPLDVPAHDPDRAPDDADHDDEPPSEVEPITGAEAANARADPFEVGLLRASSVSRQRGQRSEADAGDPAQGWVSDARHRPRPPIAVARWRGETISVT